MAEFSVIVIGVLVALLAESAWEERGERAEEAEALERIREELALDSVVLYSDLEWFEQVVPIIEASRTILAGESFGSSTGDLALLTTAGFRRNDGRDARTYDDLLASGRMSLIQDPAVRRALITFYGDLDQAIEARESLPTRYRERVTAQLPVSYLSNLLNECIRENGGRDQGIPANVAERSRGCDFEPEGGALPVLNRLRTLPGLSDDLGTLGFASYNSSERSRAAATSFHALRELLETE